MDESIAVSFEKDSELLNKKILSWEIRYKNKLAILRESVAKETDIEIIHAKLTLGYKAILIEMFEEAKKSATGSQK